MRRTVSKSGSQLLLGEPKTRANVFDREFTQVGIVLLKLPFFAEKSTVVVLPSLLCFTIAYTLLCKHEDYSLDIHHHGNPHP